MSEIHEMQQKLALLQRELSELRDAQYQTLRLVDRLTAQLEEQRLSQLRLKRSYANFDERLRNTTLLAENIEQSRIWQTLKQSAALLLSLSARLQGKPLPPLTTAPHTPTVPSNRKRPSLRPRDSVDNRASATRHSAGRAKPADWISLLQPLVRTSLPAGDVSPRLTFITPAWNTSLSWFAELAVSILEQSDPRWEWIIVDDASTERTFHNLFPVLQTHPHIRVIQLTDNRNISGATNEGLLAATAEYVAFVDHDDLLHPQATATCLQALDSGLDAVYTDSDKVDSFGLRSEPFFKPAWSPEYFRRIMYVGHLLCVRRELALAAGQFDSHFDRIQDYEFFLRVSERTSRIGHIPRVLYHWRTVPGSIASHSDAKGTIATLQQQAVQQHLDRLHLPAIAEPGPSAHRISIRPATNAFSDRVSIVIPTRDAADVLEKCLTSIFDKSTYRNFEVILCDNDTQDPRALALFKRYDVKVVPCPGKFNYSRVNNQGVAASSGSQILFLNNDVEVIEPQWLEYMLFHATQKDVGAVGAKLLYPDQTVQHAGVILGMRGTADHAMRFAPADSDGYFGSLSCAHEVSAVTAACLMLKRSDFDAIGGFNEHYFTAYQDVDLCLSLRRRGLRNIYEPSAVLTHYESRTRGKYYDHVDRHLLLDRFDPELRAGDPYYNPNLELETGDYRPAAA